MGEAYIIFQACLNSFLFRPFCRKKNWQMNFGRSTLNDKIKIDSMANVPLLNIEHEQRQLPPDDHVVQCKDFQAFQLQMK